jgi:hypothetical protein
LRWAAEKIAKRIWWDNREQWQEFLQTGHRYVKRVMQQLNKADLAGRVNIVIRVVKVKTQHA